jgi:hypothetical protein
MNFDAYDAELEQIGRELFEQSDTEFGAAPPSPRQLIGRGRAWLEREIPRIREAICGNAELLRRIATMPAVEAATIVGDVFIGRFGATDFPCLSCARFVCAVGIKSLCASGNV